MRRTNLRVAVLICFLIIISWPGRAKAQERTLKSVIDAKTKELQEIHRQIEKTQEQLFAAEKKKRSLQQDVRRSVYSINQLNLAIKSSKLTLEKLGLEINSLNISSQEAQRKIELKKRAINSILRELQIQDHTSVVETLLKNQSLAEGLREIQNLAETKNKLANDIKKLKDLKQSLKNRLEEASHKKQEAKEESRASEIKKVLLEKEKRHNSQLLTLTKSQAAAYEERVNNLIRQQEAIAREIEAMEAKLRKQINSNLLPQPRPGVLGWPVRGYRLITQGYGATSFARYGYRGKWHNGIDIGAPLGTPVLSTGGGVVVNIGNQDKYCRRGAYGKYIVIRRPDNLVVMYAHLSKIAVSPGDKVSRGGVVGYVGSTGYSTGPHLHFSVFDGGTFKMRPSRVCGPMPSGGDIDPMKYL